MSDGPRYQILTRPLPAALSVIRFWAQPAEMKLRFSRLPQEANRPVLARLQNVDHGLLNWEGDDCWIFTPHGGPGVLDALRSRLGESGWVESTNAAAFGFASAGWKAEIISALAEVEADYQARALLAAYHHDAEPEDLEALIAANTRLPLVVLCGVPNAGKSSLFNALVVDREVIVSDEAGTTRDMIIGRIELGDGYAAHLGDLPGLREDAAGAGEAAGIALAKELAESADLRVWLASNLEEEAPDWADMRVQGKRDCYPDSNGVSAKSGAGLDDFRVLLRSQLFPDS